MPINTVEKSKKHLDFFYCNPKKYLTSRLCNLTSRLIQKHLNLDENNPNWQLCKPSIFYRYVDDCFVVFDSPDSIKIFCDSLNEVHPNIKFTSEIQIQNLLFAVDSWRSKK